jgi:hypothetical protein
VSGVLQRAGDAKQTFTRQDEKRRAVEKRRPPNQLLLLIPSPHIHEYSKTVLQAGWPHS